MTGTGCGVRSTTTPLVAGSAGVAPGGPFLRPLATIAKDAPLEAAVAAMQAGGTHFALVVDGEETIGAAILEDVVERAIGEVRDVAQLPHTP